MIIIKTVTLTLGEGRDDEIYDRAGALLRGGELVIIPTETVYGLAASIYSDDALRGIYAAKGRPSDNPLIVHVSDAAMVETVASEIPPLAKKLFEKFWPGPLTLVLPKRESLSPLLSGGLDTVAVRCPQSPAARAIISAAGVPLAAPSANISGRPSPTQVSHIAREMDGRVALIVDGGRCSVGVESTVLSLVDGVRLLRPGAVTQAQLEEVCGRITVDSAVLGELSAGAVASAPGMKYRHYAPSCKMTLFAGENAAQSLLLEAQRVEKSGGRVGIICFDEQREYFGENAPANRTVMPFGGRTDHAEQARRIFDLLRTLSELSPDVILSVCPERDGVGLAVYNRMLKAAGHDVRS